MSYTFGQMAQGGRGSAGAQSGYKDPTDAEMAAHLEECGFWDRGRMFANENTSGYERGTTEAHWGVQAIGWVREVFGLGDAHRTAGVANRIGGTAVGVGVAALDVDVAKGISVIAVEANVQFCMQLGHCTLKICNPSVAIWQRIQETIMALSSCLISAGINGGRLPQSCVSDGNYCDE